MVVIEELDCDMGFEEKRQQLLLAAIDLFSKQGFWNSSTAAIAKHAGVATGTLFNYFDSKDALIDEVYLFIKQDVFDAMLTNMPVKTGPLACLEHAWFHFVRWSLEHEVRCNLLLQLKISDAISQGAIEKMNQYFAPAIEQVGQLFEQGLVRPMAPEYFNELFVAQVEACAHYASARGLKDMELAKHITLGFDVFWQGVRSHH